MKRPRPIRVAIAIVAGANAIALSVIPVLQSFDIIMWSAQQVGLVEALVGTLTTAIGGVIAAITGEKQVTPVLDPMGNEGTPLVPIAGDGLED